MNNTYPALRLATTLLLLLGASACSSSDNMLSGQPSLDTARVAMSSGATELGLNICNNLLQKRPSDANLLVCRGDALVAMGRSAEAIPAYEQALRSDGKSAAAKIGLGRVTLATDPARAEALFLAALTSDPRNPAALNNLGIARDLQGRHREAQTAYGEAIAAAPTLRAPEVNLALSMAMTGRAAEAVRIMRPIANSPNATVRERHDLAAVLAMDGQADEAAQLLRTDMTGTQADEAVIGYRSLPAR